MKRLLMAFFLIPGWMMFLYSGDLGSPDTTENHYEDLTDLLSLKLFTLTKSNTLEIIYDPEGRVILRPNGNTNLGVGFNYKSVGLALSFGRPLVQSSIEKYGNTKGFDLQMSY